MFKHVTACNSLDVLSKMSCDMHLPREIFRLSNPLDTTAFKFLHLNIFTNQSADP